MNDHQIPEELNDEMTQLPEAVELIMDMATAVASERAGTGEIVAPTRADVIEAGGPILDKLFGIDENDPLSFTSTSKRVATNE